MAQIKEIVEIENSRTEEQLALIRLFREGSFLRAYEWSAWLCCKFVGNLKVTKKQIKGIDKPVAYVGFPLTSIDKYTPSGAEILPEADGSLIVALSKDALPADADKGTLENEFEHWKDETPLVENSKKVNNDALMKHEMQSSLSHSPSNVEFLLRRIVSYPVETRTPVDNLQFISEIKNLASSLI